MKPDNRSRSYSANAFLTPNLGRTNLVVLEGATVSKIDLTTSGEDVAATGVEYIPDGGSEAVSVPLTEGGSVIVTAGKLLWSNNRLRLIVLVIGTYQSSKILELSGKYHGAAGI